MCKLSTSIMCVSRAARAYLDLVHRLASQIPRALDAGRASLLWVTSQGDTLPSRADPSPLFSGRKFAYTTSLPPDFFDLSLSAFSYASLLELDDLASKAFPFLTAWPGMWRFTRRALVIVLTPGPERLPFPSSDKLFTFLVLLVTNATELYQEAQHDFLKAIAAEVREPCQARTDDDRSTSRYEAEKLPLAHPLGNEAITAWKDTKTVITAVHFREVARRLLGGPRYGVTTPCTPCARCNRCLKMAAQNVLEGFRDFKKTLWLNLRNADGEGYL